MSLDQHSDDDLRKELARREEVRKKEALEKALVYARNMEAGLTQEMVNLVAPEHGRTSCSDTNIANGWGSRDYGPRCTRCALLEASKGYWDPDFRLVVTLEKRSM